MKPTDFTQKYLGMAKQVAAGTGLDPRMILAQMAHESGWGGSYGARVRNNLTGISDSDGQKNSWSNAIGFDRRPEGAYYSKYASLEDFAKDYIHVLNLGYYKKAKLTSDPVKQIQEVAKGGYAADPRYASKVTAIYDKYFKDLEVGTAPTDPDQAVKIVQETIDPSKLLAVGTLVAALFLIMND